MLHVVMSVLMPWVEQHMWMFSFRLQCLCSPDSALCRIVEILDPGLLLDRIEGTSRRDAHLATDRAPDPLQTIKNHPIRCRGP